MSERNLEIVDQRNIHPKLQEAILDLISVSNPDYRFYGHFFMYMNIQPSTQLPTAGVYMKGTRMYMDYSHKFVDSLSLEQTKWLLFHEIKHLLYKHINRTKTSGYDHKKSNIVQDMIINTIIKEDFDGKIIHAIKGEIGEGEDMVKIPELLVPPEYDKEQPDNRMYEPLYRWVSDIEDEMRKNGELDGDDGEGQEGEGGCQGTGRGVGGGHKVKHLGARSQESGARTQNASCSQHCALVREVEAFTFDLGF